MITTLLLGACLSQINPVPVPVAPSVPVPRTDLPAGATMQETQVAQCPLPATSPAFGNVLDFAGDRLVMTGACIVRQPGA